ncbi:unnamed protein product [Notodromas monacha]|uniref:Uncharacterized protein n=1 Tax=Notodromas monacha TaxID=399045 RepID=A0A7R9BW81_9CRUS|nr:unnamed protein product [Notodromas monacha]CAG0921262.1 unnamed protein product [Notodromas monacha]
MYLTETVVNLVVVDLEVVVEEEGIQEVVDQDKAMVEAQDKEMVDLENQVEVMVVDLEDQVEVVAVTLEVMGVTSGVMNMNTAMVMVMDMNTAMVMDMNTAMVMDMNTAMVMDMNTAMVMVLVIEEDLGLEVLADQGLDLEDLADLGWHPEDLVASLSLDLWVALFQLDYLGSLMALPLVAMVATIVTAEAPQNLELDLSPAEEVPAVVDDLVVDEQRYYGGPYYGRPYYGRPYYGGGGVYRGAGVAIRGPHGGGIYVGRGGGYRRPYYG